MSLSLLKAGLVAPTATASSPAAAAPGTALKAGAAVAVPSEMSFAGYLGQITETSRPAAPAVAAPTLTATAPEAAPRLASGSATRIPILIPLGALAMHEPTAAQLEQHDTIPDLRALIATIAVGHAPAVETPAAGKLHAPAHAPAKAASAPDPSQLWIATTMLPVLPAIELPHAAEEPATASAIAPTDDAAPAIAHPATATAPAEARAPTAQAAPAKPADATEPAADSAPRTPLEQAVHDLIDQMRGGSDHARAATAERAPDEPPPRSAPATPTAAPIAPPVTHAAEPTPHVPGPAAAAPIRLHETVAAVPNHLHLVLGEGDERVVLTVAVRGADINVNVRASDDHTAAALARNAGALDDAMRGRGLHLADFSADHEQHAPRERDRPHRDAPAPRAETPDDAEPFVLEEPA